MTNILLLPKFSGLGTSFYLTTNSDWLDVIQFAQTGSPPSTSAACSISSSSPTVTMASTAGLVPGQPVIGIGIPTGATILAIPTALTLTLSANATATSVEALLTFNPVPLDLTNINFVCNIRAEAGATQALVTAQTSDNTMINGQTAGTLTFNVPVATMANVQPGTYALDIVAFDSTHTINLFPQGPATVTIAPGVTPL